MKGQFLRLTEEMCPSVAIMSLDLGPDIGAENAFS
jgi:hypothetical protein